MTSKVEKAARAYVVAAAGMRTCAVEWAALVDAVNAPPEPPTWGELNDPEWASRRLEELRVQRLAAVAQADAMEAERNAAILPLIARAEKAETERDALRAAVQTHLAHLRETGHDSHASARMLQALMPES